MARPARRKRQPANTYNRHQRAFGHKKRIEEWHHHSLVGQVAQSVTFDSLLMVTQRN